MSLPAPTGVTRSTAHPIIDSAGAPACPCSWSLASPGRWRLCWPSALCDQHPDSYQADISP
jgi:hypothetical protein